MPARSLALAAAVHLLAGSASGAPDGVAKQPESPALSPVDITGKDFAGYRFQEPAREGRLGFTCSRANVWKTGPKDDPVTRMYLEGDVKAKLGALEFSAARAVVWLQPIGGTGTATEYQFFIYFDRVSMPTAAPDSSNTITLSGDRVPVKGVLRTSEGVTLMPDLLLDGPADDPLVREGERALAAYLRDPSGTGIAARRTL